MDPDTGGGLINAAGIVLLRASVANPALGGADRFTIGSTDQIGTPRPSPAGTNPDTGSVESRFAHSTVSSANNDTLTGTAAANTLNGLAGNDFLKGLGGADTLSGGDGGDLLEGGAGNDRLNGGTGVDTANYGDTGARVVVDLRGDPVADTDTARRGTETDTLTGIDGAIAGGGNDRFFGGQRGQLVPGRARQGHVHRWERARPLRLQPGQPEPGRRGRDVVTDFDHLVDDIDRWALTRTTPWPATRSSAGSATRR